MKLSRKLQNSDIKCPRCGGNGKKYLENKNYMWNCYTCQSYGFLRNIQDIIKSKKV